MSDYNDRIAALSHDERSILDLLLSRLEQGAAVYGQWALHDDTRDMAAEATEEIIDAMHYIAAMLLRARR